ncbi:dipeptide/oligopeptide/nickel ABC transporter permease/ATP-binding protein [Paramicrobacterium fandaimingii]|uniref:dipeptide/oligopeptide/nickel ABC transporter permease/ATP-binding protein n=1 Tax=Paramicrobacterium fandaimingii TaxID=2708079 RepID=UPI00141E78C0|nr:dipeptide/oligopeptide/nickel ABC transporter permease/ATP-binding protein [Microbacterium fandaimingii]
MTDTTTIALRGQHKRRARGRLFRSPTALLSILWLVGVVVASLSAPLWLRYGPLEQDLTVVLQGPSAAHFLGTDELGRDILARLTVAAAPTLLIAALTPIVAVAVTVPVTLLAARNPRVENIVNRVSEIVLSLPGIVIILAFIAAVGTNMPLVMAVFGLLLFGAMFKIFFGQAKSLHQQLFVDAAAVDGVRPMVASIRHVLPNMANTVIVQFVLLFGAAIGLQAGLAFIGLGPQPPEPTWGGMIQTASQFIFQQPWMMVPTGGVLALTIVAANALADVLGDGNAKPPPLVSIRRKKKKHTTDAAAPTEAGLPGDGSLVVDRLVIGVDDGPSIVTGISLHVQPGTVMGLVGESGCGKSVTSHALLGLLSPGLSVRSGRIDWDGVGLAHADEKALQRVRGHEIAYISQEPTRALDPIFTVGWQLSVTVKRLRRVPRREAKRIAAQLLDDVGIVDPPRVLECYPHQISGGMAQRVAIALALAGAPRLLIADEPTTALDVTVQAEILALLRGLVADRGMSIILVTHDLGVVADLADDVSVMYAGQIVETGTVRDVLMRPEHPYTMALLAADPHAVVELAGATHLASIPGQVPAPGSWPSGCRFADRCRFARPGCLVPVAVERRVTGTGEVRCIRHEDVRDRGQEWLPVHVGGES